MRQKVSFSILNLEFSPEVMFCIKKWRFKRAKDVRAIVEV